MIVIKRNGAKEPFDISKLKRAINNAFGSVGEECPEEVMNDATTMFDRTLYTNEFKVEDIQDAIENCLMSHNCFKAAKAYIIYREKHRNARFIRERIDYMNRYSDSGSNASSSSETDSNANVTIKNVANLEGEVYKTTNRIIQRQRMKNQLQKMFPEVADKYLEDVEHHIVYPNDEASSPVLKPYCMAASLYPLMYDGVGNIDGVTPSAPNDIQSFSGQVTNLVFLLSSQCKGAVALGEYFVALNYYIVSEFGEKWYDYLDVAYTTSSAKVQRTVRDAILKGFKQFVWGINQPAGNRSYQSPFTNISYYDKTYFNTLFEHFVYPDNTKPEWKAIDTLQRMFMKWFNQLRLKKFLTFPVETFAMVCDKEHTHILDSEYEDLCAEMYAEGHSFFTYISDSADSLASCCRLRNELQENTFSPTSGLTGIMTGSCNVYTLNISRITQDWANELGIEQGAVSEWESDSEEIFYSIDSFKKYLTEILERVYKYHIAYKTMLYDLEDKGMFSACNGGYIHISKLYSTVGINGLNEAARFLGLKVSNNPEYIAFLQVVLGTIKEQNKKHSIHDKKRPFLFNSEVVPAEGLGPKNYKWDKAENYWVPDDENLYNSYFYNAHDDTPVLDKFILHGRQTYKYTDGGSALHCNLYNHLTKDQYSKLIKFAIEQGTSYFTFNIPNSECKDCGHIVKHPVLKCPKCGGSHIDLLTRIIGYVRPLSAYDEERYKEALRRIYSQQVNI